VSASLTYSRQLSSAAASYDSACDCCGHSEDEGTADYLRNKIKEAPQFIAEAIGNADLGDLIAAYLSGDLQYTHDALSDIVSDYLPVAEDAFSARLKGPWHHAPSEVEVVEKMCEQFGVEA